uniref:Prefoldin subunit 2 n=1 Tax=Physcomitrium patens TaxID=3218 RepID=A0A2K1IFB4_PHYPA|nr:hypothetical protein PHYPA_028560 [Physcomitrium patens]
MAESGANKMEMVNEQAVAGKWNYMRSELNQLYNKINELEQELNEHQLVISAIQPLDPGRKCFRMIGGVLVERTKGLQEVINRLVKALEKKTKEFAGFETKYKIKVRKGDDVVPANSEKASASQGVLV